MDIFSRFKKVVKIREVLVDNEVFQLHYRVTALLLLGCAALVASKQHFGDPIDCITRDDVPNKIMDTYCWIHATFTLPSACNKTVGVEVSFVLITYQFSLSLYHMMINEKHTQLKDHSPFYYASSIVNQSTGCTPLC